MSTVDTDNTTEQWVLLEALDKDGALTEDSAVLYQTRSAPVLSAVPVAYCDGWESPRMDDRLDAAMRQIGFTLAPKWMRRQKRSERAALIPVVPVRCENTEDKG